MLSIIVKIHDIAFNLIHGFKDTIFYSDNLNK